MIQKVRKLTESLPNKTEIMDRELEPEIMDDQTQAAAYANADFSSSNQSYVDGSHPPL